MLLKFKKRQTTPQAEIGFLPDCSDPRVISVALIAAVILAIMFALAAIPPRGWPTMENLTSAHIIHDEPHPKRHISSDNLTEFSLNTGTKGFNHFLY